MFTDTIQALSAIAQTIIAVAAFTLTIIVWQQNRRERKAESSRIIQDTWNVVNTLAVTDIEILKIIDEMFDNTTISQNVEARRKRWAAFCVLNALQITFLEERYGTLDREYANQTFTQLLPSLLRDDEIYKLTQTRGYHPEFAKYCYEIKKRIAAFATAIITSEKAPAKSETESYTFLEKLLNTPF